MTTHLITFLGRAKLASTGGDLQEEPARCYRFPDGDESDAVRLFVRAAVRHLDRGRRRPDRLLVLGTAGSMWDTLLTDLADADADADAEADADWWSELHERVAQRSVQQAHADRVSGTLTRRLGRPVRCVVLPAGTTEAEQLAVLSAMSDGVGRGDRLLLDVTHRYRHLPMAGLLAAELLAYDRECRLLDVWYADLQMAEGTPPTCPVVSLKPLLAMQRWGRAFAVLRESGRYAPIAELLGDHPAAELLRDTGFHLTTNQVPEGRRSGTRARKALAADASEDPLFQIVRDDLLADLHWVAEPRIWNRMLEVARRALEGGDHLAAVTLTQEALYWAAAGCFWDGEKPQHSEPLDALKRRITAELRRDRGDVARFHLLRKLRNAAAHGLKPSGRWAGEVRRVLANANNFHQTCTELIDWVDGLATRWDAKP